MKLSIKERLVLLGILPAEGSFITLKVLRKLRGDLSFSEEEIKQYKFVQENGRVTWDNSVEQMKPIAIGTQAKIIVKDSLKRLDEQEQLKEDHFSIYEKFVEV